MRIAFLVNQFPALSETFILDQIVGLIDRGHEVDIYSNLIGNTDKVHPEVESYQLLNRTFYAQMPTRRTEKVLKALGLIIGKGWQDPTVIVNSLNFLKYQKKATSLRLIYSASRFIGKEPYDIIHCQLGFLGYDGVLFREVANLKGKLMTTFRGSDFMIYMKMFGKNYFDRLFEECDLILTVCEKMREQKIELGCDPNKIIVHRDGIDLSRFELTPRHIGSDGEVRVLSIARLEENKGIQYGIQAVAKLVPTLPNIQYHIIGDGSIKQELQDLINELQVNDNVKLLGWKQRPEVIAEINAAHILIAPSVLGKNGTQEGIPSVLKEAMAMGLPVVSTYHSGIPELIEDGVSGFLVPEWDVDALVEKLGYLIRHPELWPNMGYAGRSFLEKHYDVKQLNDRLVEIYEKVLQS